MTNYACHIYDLQLFDAHYLTKASCESAASSLKDFLSKGRKSAKKRIKDFLSKGRKSAKNALIMHNYAN